MTDKLFYKLWQDALAEPDKEIYVHEYGYPEWFDEISQDSNQIIETLKFIHDIAHMSMRSIIEYTGLSQAKFAEKFCIPRRTVEDWARGVSQPPSYIRLMICQLLGLIDKDCL